MSVIEMSNVTLYCVKIILHDLEITTSITCAKITSVFMFLLIPLVTPTLIGANVFVVLFVMTTNVFVFLLFLVYVTTAYYNNYFDLFIYVFVES